MLEQMKAIVTGGLGFVGSHLVDLLVSEGFSVLVIDDLSTGRIESWNDKAAYIIEDILSVEPEVFQEAHCIFHLAALARIQPSFDQPIQHENANVIATLDLLTKVKGSKNLRRLVVASSSAIYGNPKKLPTTEQAQIRPLNPYAVQKYAAEQYCLMFGKRFGFEVVALRYFNVYGPRSFNEKNPYNAYSSVIGIFSHQKAMGVPLTITGDGVQKRDFVHVRDVARANLMAALSTTSSTAFNVGSGTCISIQDVASLFEHEYVFIAERGGEARVTWADTSKIRATLGWHPEITLEEGIEELCEE